jgi:hypothetical protein
LLMICFFNEELYSTCNIFQHILVHDQLDPFQTDKQWPIFSDFFLIFIISQRFSHHYKTKRRTKSNEWQSKQSVSIWIDILL